MNEVIAGVDLGAAELLARWARALDLDIRHASGCPGIVVPGVGLLIDTSIPAPERHGRIAELLRSAGRFQAP
jgi:hypothetical protein